MGPHKRSGGVCIFSAAIQPQRSPADGDSVIDRVQMTTRKQNLIHQTATPIVSMLLRFPLQCESLDEITILFGHAVNADCAEIVLYLVELRECRTIDNLSAKARLFLW